MKLHEYQAKDLLREYGLPVSVCYAARDVDEAIDYAQRIGGGKWVLKIQVHSSFRYKQGGVVIASSYSDIENFCRKWLGKRFICPETTDSFGLPVSAILIERFVNFEQEYYLSVAIDREKAAIALMVSNQGGVDIEDVVDNQLAAIHKITIDLLLSSQPFQIRGLCKQLAFCEEQTEQFIDIATKLVRLFVEKDLIVLEINPFIIRRNGRLHFLDAKMETDENARYRHSEFVALEDLSQQNDAQRVALRYNFSYIQAASQIGCIVNGSGLAMALLDSVSEKSGEAVSMLNIGGNIATEDTICAACEIVLSNKNIGVILVNIFTVVSNCTVIAKALIKVATQTNTNIIFIVRLQGVNAAAANNLLRKERIATLVCEPVLDSALQLVVANTRQPSDSDVD